MPAGIWRIPGRWWRIWRRARRVRRWRRSWGALRVELRELPAPPAVAVARVLARARAASAPRRRWWWVAAAAAVAVMVVVAVVSRRTGERPVVVGQVVEAGQPLPGGRGSVSGSGVRKRRRTPGAARRQAAAHESPETTDVVMRLETDDPDVVFYLSSDSKGEKP